ncbi:MAG: 4a-hydroxytetrahydrobiopterin dehydratase [Epsilonproteobacteria bacterium]|nr:4a-hydroxytetrahydrobiopterin dehydratase [Campylobacterota bacterium]
MLKLGLMLLMLSVGVCSCAQTKQLNNLARKKCVPCKGGTPPMSAKEERTYLKHVPEWHKSSDNPAKISREFTLSTFKKTLAFVNEVADIAEQEGHHPDIILNEQSLRFDLYTHKIGGLAESDFVMAAKIDVISPNEQGRSTPLSSAARKSAPVLSEVEKGSLLRGLTGWRVVNEPEVRLTRRYVFKNFEVAMSFLNEFMGEISPAEQNFELQLFYNRMRLDFYSKDVHDLTAGDFNAAMLAENLYQKYKRLEG